MQRVYAQLHTVYVFSIHLLNVGHLLSVAWKTGTGWFKKKTGLALAGTNLPQTQSSAL